MKKQWKVYIGIVITILLFNLTAWNFTGFCDWYIRYVMPIWVNTYGRLMGIFPFSVGEVMIMLGIALVIVVILLSLYFVIRIFVQALKKRRRPLKWPKYLYSVVAWIVLWIVTVMSLNYTVLYHGTSFNEKYLGREDKQYTLEQLLTVRNYIVEKCNALSADMPRDENGNVIYNLDMEDMSITTMQELGKSYDGLGGFYPRPKTLFMSDLMCQQYMQGYFFPFSMEANYNSVMYIVNKPAAICHELAHLKGFINEDEANFISYLACISSKDSFIQYSGYMSVLYYIDNDFYDAIGKDNDRYKEQIRILPQVQEDNVFVKEEEWDRINEKALVDTEVVDSISDQFTETYLKLNGVTDGMISYSRVVKLLLQYYDGRLF